MYGEKNWNSKVQIRKDLFIRCLVLVVMAAIAVGGVEQGSIEVDANEPQIGAVGADNSENFVSQSKVVFQKDDASVDKAIQSISFKKDMAVRDALTFLALKYGKNIVPSPNVDGSLAFTSLFDVTFEEAMDAILGVDFKYVQEGNLTKVYTADEYKSLKTDESRMEHRVFTLYYITAAEVKKLVQPVLSEKGKIESTSPALLGVPVEESITADTGGGDTTAVQDILVLYDYPENLAKAKEVIRSVDVRPKQVLIEATILSATLTENMQFGINWQTLKGSAVSQISDIASGAPDYLGFAGTGAKVSSALTGGMTIGLAIDDVAAFIKAVEEITDVTILANPKILAVNKQLGQVFIGKKVAYVSQTTQTDTSTTSEVEFLDTGTKLSFRPYIGDDGYIRMDIHPKDSSYAMRTIASGTSGEQSLPDETSAELVTNIMVKDGQTIVIGGLFRDKVHTTRTQIPVLGDLPFVGAAFRGTADAVRREEVIVLLTPHIIEEPSETEGNARAADIGRKRLGARNELSWLSRARLAEDSYSRAVSSYLAGDRREALRELNWTLNLRPSYLEALRLQERIIREVSPDDAGQIERIMLGVIEKEEAKNWQRR